jgi:biopolymer transport protein TolQ
LTDIFFAPVLAQVDFWGMVGTSGLVPLTVMAVLLGSSLLSFTIFFSKYGAFRKAAEVNQQFLRAFRKTQRMDAMAAATEQFKSAPLANVFEFGYTEVCRQVNARATVTNLLSLERSLQLGISEEIGRLEKNMSWLATIAAVAPFIGLLGTVVGIIDAFQVLGGASGSAGISAVGPGISVALYTTALGLFAAVPAAVMFNYFNNSIKEMGQRMDDFSLEFLNMTERNFGEQ